MSDTPQKKRGFFGRLFGAETAPADMKPTPSQTTVEGPPPVRRTAVPSPTIDVEAAGSACRGFLPQLSQTRRRPSRSPPRRRSRRRRLIRRARGWFARLTSGLSRTSSKLSEGITGLFTKRKLDAATLDDLEDLLIQSDLGVDTAMRITSTLSKGRFDKGILPEDVKAVLAAEVERVLAPVAKPLVIDAAKKPHTILVVGVNGTGKTTTIGKLAQQYRREGKKVMLAAGDTFRAAAIEQLKIWGERTGATVLARDLGSDASGLAFDALNEARIGGYDVLLMDTAGRLQNKAALMEELEKVVRVLEKVEPTAPHDVLLVLDATTGQNALNAGGGVP